jgi:pimeloyl-ACP methyl ester carboxylesterase
MKQIALTVLTVLSITFSGFGQAISGQWNGALKIGGSELRLVFHINQTENGYSATMDSPDQGAKGIPVTSVSFENNVLKIAATNLGLSYEGVLENERTIKGSFKQGGYTSPLDLSKGEMEIKAVRPQEPLPPYPYHEEEVVFENTGAGISLSGTLTLPQKEGHFPAVVLITGSGAQNRNEELFDHKPFLVISDYLTRNGIAVLRFDDRGVGASTGNFRTATTYDFSTDVEAGVKYLQTRKEINRQKIGLIGHSEGGIIAPMLAARSKDISFIVLLAGTGIPGDQLLLLQQELSAKASGMSEQAWQSLSAVNRKAFDLIIQSTDTARLKSDLTSYLKQVLKGTPDVKPKSQSEEDFIRLQITLYINPWMQYFLKYNPAVALEKVKCPVLAINGEKDLQVPAKINLEAIQKALVKGGNKKVTVKEIPGLNHLFQECQTGLPTEYATIEQTFSPIALEEVLKWIHTTVK